MSPLGAEIRLAFFDPPNGRTKIKMVARLLPFLLATPGALGKKVSHDEAKCVMEGRSIARARAPRPAPPFFEN